MISNIMGSIVIPLMMFMAFAIYFIVIFAEYGLGRVWQRLRKIGRIIQNATKKRKD